MKADGKRIHWPEGEFYVPGLSSTGLTAPVPGAVDASRRLFLRRAAVLEPILLETLQGVADNEHALSAWAERWHLTDRWCLALARDTLRWWAADPKARGWEFESYGIAVGHFPFKIKPLKFAFYYDPTYRKRHEFKAHVLLKVKAALKAYCDDVQAPTAAN